MYLFDSDDLQWLRGLQGWLLLQTYIDMPNISLHSVRSKPVRPCENTPPCVNDEVKNSFTQIIGTKGQLLNASVPLELFLDQVRQGLKIYRCRYFTHNRLA